MIYIPWYRFPGFLTLYFTSLYLSFSNPGLFQVNNPPLITFSSGFVKWVPKQVFLVLLPREVQVYMVLLMLLASNCWPGKMLLPQKVPS